MRHAVLHCTAELRDTVYCSQVVKLQHNIVVLPDQHCYCEYYWPVASDGRLRKQFAPQETLSGAKLLFAKTLSFCEPADLDWQCQTSLLQVSALEWWGLL